MAQTPGPGALAALARAGITPIVTAGAAGRGFGPPSPKMVKAVRGVQPSGITTNPALDGTALGNAIAGTSPMNPSPAGHKAVNVRAMQQFLVTRGYNIPVDGQNGPLTKAAQKDFTSSRNPKGFNQKYGLASGGKRTSIVDNPLTGAGGLLTKSGNMSPGYAASAADPPTPPADPPIDVTGLVKLATNVGLQIPPSVLKQLQGLDTSPGKPLDENSILAGLNPDTATMIPTSNASALAGLQYDAPIHDLGLQIARAPVQGAQDLADIKNWYDQVQGAQGTAASRDSALSSAGVGSISDAVKNIVSSLGGAANAGSGDVAASGADQVGLLQALGTSQDQYNQDLAPLLKSEAAGASASQLARENTSAADLHSQLLDLLGQRGQAEKQALMDIVGQNNASRQQNFSNAADVANMRSTIRQANQGMSQQEFDNALNKLSSQIGILGTNNQVRQQNFNNNLSVQQAQEAAALSGARLITANASATRAAASLANAAKAKTGPAPSSSSISRASTDAAQAFPSGVKGVPIPTVVQKVNDAFRAAGLNVKTSSVAQAAMAVLRHYGITPNPAWYGLH